MIDTATVNKNIELQNAPIDGENSSQKMSQKSKSNQIAPQQQNQAQVIENQSVLSNFSELRFGDSVRFDFQNVCYDVDTKQGKKRILNNVSGFVMPGEMLYIMGPSGGGKTSLLDYLCNRTQQSPENNVYLNKKKWTEKEFKRVSKYCKQHPQLYEILTVQETLFNAASFFTKTKEEAQERVDMVIELLGLEAQRNTKIGGMFFRGISGGQKQRVSVGEQLVANPKILFLDEPTSGLDSASAFKLMENLKEICQKTKISVIASIHQPSQRVFDMSDRLIVLAGGKNFGGNTAFFGPTDQLETHFEQIGIPNKSKCSMSEWILDEVNGDFGKPENIQKIIDNYKTSALKQETDKKLDYIEKQKQGNGMELYQFNGPNTKSSYLKDVLSLFMRGFKNNIKNPLAVLIRILTYCVMGMILGTVWWGAGSDPIAGEIANINGVLFFVSSFFVVMSISVLPINIEDRQIMVKERSNGCYSLSAYSISNFLAATPFTFIIALCASFVVFFMIQLDNENGTPFILFVIDLFVALCAAEGLVLIISYAFSHLLVCIVLASQIFGSFMIMSGFFIKATDIPDGWIWLHHSAFTTYTFQNLMYNVYNELSIGKDLNTIPPTLEDYPGKLVLEALDMEEVNTGINILVVCMFAIGFRLIAHFYSLAKHTGKK